MSPFLEVPLPELNPHSKMYPTSVEITIAGQPDAILAEKVPVAFEPPIAKINLMSLIGKDKSLKYALSHFPLRLTFRYHVAIIYNTRKYLQLKFKNLLKYVEFYSSFYTF